MHTDIGFFDIIFKLTLFSLISYKLYGIIKEYLIPFLIQQIAQEHKQQTELLEKEKLLESTQRRVKTQIYNQKQMFILLEKNVLEWHKAKQSENHELELENLVIIEKVKEKRAYQKENLVLLNNIQQGLPIALEQATKELEAKYGGQTGKELLDKVINQLPGNASFIK